VLREQDHGAVRLALETYRSAHPDAKPGWCCCDDCSTRPMDKSDNLPHEDLDATLARLTWLEFWIRWALDNCEHPAIYNH